jgi:hypothetical protein
MQAVERGFGGVSCSVGLDAIFWLAKISQKQVEFSTVLGGAPNRARELLS